MLCHEFELAFEQADSGLLPGAAAHLEECASCRAMVADLNLIRSSARDLAVLPQEPSERVWTGLRSHLIEEGIIRQPELVVQPPATWQDQLFAWLRHPVLAGAYAALAVAAIGLLWLGNPGQPPAAQTASVASVAPDISSRLASIEAATVRQLHPDQSEADASLKRSIAVVDNFIAMCEKTVRENPRDEAAREYLFGAYQQKSELLATVVEHSWAGE